MHRQKNKLVKWSLVITGILILALLIVVFTLDYRVSRRTRMYLYSSPSSLPFNHVGLVLGTSKFLRKGKINEYWENRIEAACMLYRMKKIRYIIVSGDNSKRYYDEPTVMKKELVRRGIPASVIFLDYAGFRTFDSMIRAGKIFSQNSFTVISQRFHSERAVYIARHFGMNAIGYCAGEVTAYSGLKTKIREKLARTRLFLDLATDRQPRFLGEKVPVR